MSKVLNNRPGISASTKTLLLTNTKEVKFMAELTETTDQAVKVMADKDGKYLTSFVFVNKSVFVEALIPKQRQYS